MRLSTKAARMQPPPLLFDGLQRALCPGVRCAAWQSVMRGPAALPGRRSIQQRIYVTTKSPSRPHHSAYSTENEHATGYDASEVPTIKQSNVQRQGQRSPTFNTSSPLLAATSPEESELHAASTEEIKEAIMVIRQVDELHAGSDTEFDSLDRLALLTTHLVLHRDMRDDPFVYESLMDGMAHPRGSASVIGRLFRDSSRSGLPMTATFCRKTLRALAVHPNYLTQLKVLEVMRENWIPIEKEDIQNVILGMVRDGQHELAYLRFMDLLQAKQEPDIWVFDLLINALWRQRSHDEMVEIFKLRGEKENQDKAYPGLVYQILDSCSAAFHYQGTALTWDIGVTGDLFNPPDGMLDNILTTASIAGDCTLATAAYEKLASRTRMPRSQHRELLGAYCNAGDLCGALRVLSTLGDFADQGVDVDNISWHLRRATYEKKVEAEETARSLAREGKPAAGPCEAVILALAAREHTTKAAALADDMPGLCGTEASDRAWRTILKYEPDLEKRRGYAQRYRKRFPEDSGDYNHPRTYPRLIAACVEIEDLDLALRFTHQFVNTAPRKHFQKFDWAKCLFELALEKQDDRIWPIYDKLVEKGPAALSAWVQMFLETSQWKRPEGLEEDKFDIVNTSALEEQMKQARRVD